MFKNIFRKKSPKDLIQSLLQEFIKKAGFELNSECEQKEDGELSVEIFGEDEGLLKTRQGRVLLALQAYLNRVVHKNFPDQNVYVRLDSSNFFKKREERLLELALKLKEKVIVTGRPVYLNQELSPFQRRKVHRLLSQDREVKTLSIGEGFYKNIRIMPAKFQGDEAEQIRSPDGGM